MEYEYLMSYFAEEGKTVFNSSQIVPEVSDQLIKWMRE